MIRTALLFVAIATVMPLVMSQNVSRQNAQKTHHAKKALTVNKQVFSFIIFDDVKSCVQSPAHGKLRRMAMQPGDDMDLKDQRALYTEEENMVDKYNDEDEYYVEDEDEEIDWKYFENPVNNVDEDPDSESTEEENGRKLGCPSSISGGCYYPIPNPPPTFRYPYPKYGAYNLDWCHSWGVDCGKKAADAYCRYKGHLWSSTYAKNSDIGGTKLIGTGQLCSYNWCDGFTEITCVGSN